MSESKPVKTSHSDEIGEHDAGSFEELWEKFNDVVFTLDKKALFTPFFKINHC